MIAPVQVSGPNRMASSNNHYWQLQRARALVKFIRDHRSTPPENMEASIRALEKGDTDSAIRYAKQIKMYGMGGVTDWFPPVVNDQETIEYNEAVLIALIGEWGRAISTLDNNYRVRIDHQVGALDAPVDRDGHVFCPFCRSTFWLVTPGSWDGKKHLLCGARLRLVPRDGGAVEPDDTARRWFRVPRSFVVGSLVLAALAFLYCIGSAALAYLIPAPPGSTSARIRLNFLLWVPAASVALFCNLFLVSLLKRRNPSKMGRNNTTGQVQ